MVETSLPIPASDVICQEVAEGAVLFSPKDEVYFGLNEVGTLVWRQLPPVAQDFEALCDAVSRTYPDVDRDVISNDVRDLLRDLLAHGLVVRADAQEGNGSPGSSQGR